ncbi:hypothetical protein [Niabella soli]|uniref:DUF4142 domain-containing protein n=1 Tax=Niabella soli DSM 19437 TaxID=929713 RepID=W0EYG1_9BACT|nr:hypothetical protein [Niabella soli]AHF15855.1 hypothetical protein NIASO_13190 [Niabella soli DSM 19437]
MTRFLTLISILAILLTPSRSAAQSRTAFYEAFAGKSTTAIDAQLRQLGNYAGGAEKQAFAGALEMRKAGLLNVPAKKLALFKQGHKKLEAAVAASPQNGEFRLLRLMIQENAPKNLGYSKNITEDSKMVKEQYTSLPPAARQSLRNYSKISKSLAGLN